VQFALVAIVLRRRQQVAPVLVETTSITQVRDTSASDETQKEAWLDLHTGKGQTTWPQARPWGARLSRFTLQFGDTRESTRRV
jgi:hypothetical protein